MILKCNEIPVINASFFNVYPTMIIPLSIYSNFTLYDIKPKVIVKIRCNFVPELNIFRIWT